MTDPMAEDDEPQRCAILVDAALPSGRAANAAAVIALTLGRLHPELVGSDMTDASGARHPGLIPIGITVLAASVEAMREVRSKALNRGLEVVDFPIQGQQTNDYEEFRSAVTWVETADLVYVGVGVLGPRKSVGKVVGRFPLLA